MSVILRPDPDPTHERILLETFLLRSLSDH